MSIKRLYENVLKEHIRDLQQMAFLVGPRQVGKTTIALTIKSSSQNLTYLNWDNKDHRKIILAGPKSIADYAALNKSFENAPIMIFDEIHKYKNWKNFLKGFFDTYKAQTKIIVTGSARLDVYNSSGDSLMGRYFPYHIHPFSVAELLHTKPINTEINPPVKPDQNIFMQLLETGGFPEPFIMNNRRFSNRWKSTRHQQLFHDEIKNLSHIQEIAQLEILAELLKHQTGQLLNYNNLANKIDASVDTVRRWIKVLEKFYYCFTIKPWTKNIARSLIKTPKIYLWDWSDVIDPGAKAENFIASHLLKAVNLWNDLGFGNYSLHYLRDKEKHEVDFIVTKNGNAWFLVEVKTSENSGIDKTLYNFQKATKAQHAFQVIINREFVNKDCFSYTKPTIVSASTFLSQLV